MQLFAAQSSQPTSGTEANTHIVDISDLTFSPQSLEVKVGDTITWVNNDFIPHTATAVDKSWDSKNL